MNTYGSIVPKNCPSVLLQCYSAFVFFQGFVCCFRSLFGHSNLSSHQFQGRSAMNHGRSRKLRLTLGTLPRVGRIELGWYRYHHCISDTCGCDSSCLLLRRRRRIFFSFSFSILFGIVAWLVWHSLLLLLLPLLFRCQCQYPRRIFADAFDVALDEIAFRPILFLVAKQSLLTLAAIDTDGLVIVDGARAGLFGFCQQRCGGRCQRTESMMVSVAVVACDGRTGKGCCHGKKPERMMVICAP